MNFEQHIATLEQLPVIREYAIRRGQSIVCTAGCFEILHIGHIRYLEKAAGYGNILVVGIVDDATHLSIKHRESRLAQESRLATIASLRVVGHAVLFSTAYDLLWPLRPDVIVASQTSPEDRVAEKRRLAGELGATFFALPSQAEVHSSKI